MSEVFKALGVTAKGALMLAATDAGEALAEDSDPERRLLGERLLEAVERVWRETV